jgi:polysaccharide export outer membrane protein
MNAPTSALTNEHLIRAGDRSTQTVDSNDRKSHASPGLNWPRGVVALSLLATLCMVLVGCQTSEPDYTPGSGVPQADPAAADYGNEPLREGDQIMITSENVTNLNTVVRIPLSGYIDLPFIDRVRAAGKTTLELQEELLKMYEPVVRAEVITVKLLQADSSVYVSGAVLTPGKIPLNRPMTALDAIMEAGGADPQRARMSKVRVLRIENGQRRSYVLDLNKALKGDSSSLFYLKPYDTVEVPLRTINW